jgi:hypothetical protein
VRRRWTKPSQEQHDEHRWALGVLMRGIELRANHFMQRFVLVTI